MAIRAPVPSPWPAYSSGLDLIMKRWTLKPAVRYSVPENEWVKSGPVKRPWPNSAASSFSRASFLLVGNARARSFLAPCTRCRGCWALSRSLGQRRIVTAGFRPARTSDWCRPFDQLRQRQILSMLAVAEASSASAWAALRPRQENWRRPCLSLRCPMTGSTVTPRRR
jgi:hypothetical protein